MLFNYNLLQEVADFTDNFLRMDGVFTLRQIAKNTNDAVVGEVSSPTPLILTSCRTKELLDKIDN